MANQNGDENETEKLSPKHMRRSFQVETGSTLKHRYVIVNGGATIKVFTFCLPE